MEVIRKELRESWANAGERARDRQAWGWWGLKRGAGWYFGSVCVFPGGLLQHWMLQTARKTTEKHKWSHTHLYGPPPCWSLSVSPESSHRFSYILTVLHIFIVYFFNLMSCSHPSFNHSHHVPPRSSSLTSSDSRALSSPARDMWHMATCVTFKLLMQRSLIREKVWKEEREPPFSSSLAFFFVGLFVLSYSSKQTIKYVIIFCAWLTYLLYSIISLFHWLWPVRELTSCEATLLS